MLRSILDFFSSVLFLVLSIFGINRGTEQLDYQVLERLGPQIEIRQYTPRIAAETEIDRGQSGDPRGEAFRIIAGYIFGANKPRLKIDMTSPVEIRTAGSKIAMTAPVEVVKSDSSLVMRFFMPASYSLKDLPEPSDPRVRLIELPSITVAVLRFSGSTDDSAVSEQTEMLLKALQKTRWKVSGQLTALFYNPPWTIPFLRRNEIAVSVSK
jgi:effector-binding domain-containing protein